jgi:tyrosinase
VFFRISESEIWDPETGLGGNGVPGTYTVPPDPANTSRIHPDAFRGCVEDGPFANYTLKLGPGLFVTDHCLTRGFNDTTTRYLNSSTIARTMSLPTFPEFALQLEGSPAFAPDHRAHDGGHVAVGGEMSNFFSSPGGKRLIF